MARWLAKFMGKKESAVPVACPTCGVVLDPPPQRSRNCPDCGSKIVLRTDRATKEKRYLTTEGAAEFDKEKALASAKKKAMRMVEGMGLTAADYEATDAEITDKLGQHEGPGDVYRCLDNKPFVRL